MANLANLPGAAGQTAAPESKAQIPPNPAGSIVEENQGKDIQAVWSDAYNRALAGLGGMPAGSRDQTARSIADRALVAFQQMIGQGVPPAEAMRQSQVVSQNEIRRVAAENGLPDPGTLEGAAVSNEVGNSADVEKATQVYRDAVESGKDVYGRILGKTGEPDPSAIDFFEKNRVTPQSVAASTATGPRQLTGVTQGVTTVEGTDVADLQATARGEGAGQQAARARMDQLLFRQGQQASGQIQGARGYERRGLRRALIGQQAEQTIAAGKAMAEVDATTSLAAQQHVANFDARKKELQANLDAARASGDADRIQKAEADMAQLEQDVKKFNAGQTQTADTTNAANTQAAAGTNLIQGMGAIKQDFETWKQTNQLALDAQKALEQSAQGLLNEDQRQQQLALARRQLANAEKEYEDNKARADRQEQARNASQRMQFWGTIITTLLAAGTTAVFGPGAGAATAAVGGAATSYAGDATMPPGAAGAASGGIVDKATKLLVGEGGEHEIVIPLKGRVSDRLLAALSVDSKPFDSAGPSGQIDSMEDLTKAIRATLNTAPKVDDDMTSMMASATLRARRAR